MNLFLRIGLEESGPTALDVKLNGTVVKTLDAENANFVMSVGDTDVVDVASPAA